MEEIRGKWLNQSRKMVYMQHRSFLRMDHPYHKNMITFDGTKETALALKHVTGEEIFEAIKDIKIIHGKRPGSTYVPKDTRKASLWKKRSIF